MNWHMVLVLLYGALHAGDARAETQSSMSLVRRCDTIRTLLGQYRHTGEALALNEANRLIAAALEQDSSYFEAKKMEAWSALLGGPPEKALQIALALNKKMPDDLEVYGYLVDAYAKLGKLDQAEEQANWMLRLRPENPDTLRRAAELRERFGDGEGALQMWNELYRRTPKALARDRAYVLARIAQLLKKSNAKRAKVVAAESLRLAPDSLEAKKAVTEVGE